MNVEVDNPNGMGPEDMLWLWLLIIIIIVVSVIVALLLIKRRRPIEEEEEGDEGELDRLELPEDKDQ